MSPSLPPWPLIRWISRHTGDEGGAAISRTQLSHPGITKMRVSKIKGIHIKVHNYRVKM